MNKITAVSHGEDTVLPPPLQPANPIFDNAETGKFYMLENNRTGVLALGSFDANWAIGDGMTFMQHMIDGLQELKRRGATQLIVDVVGCNRSLSSKLLTFILFQSNNGGGLICAAHVRFSRITSYLSLMSRV